MSKAQPGLKILRKKILSHGGDEVVLDPRGPEPHLNELLGRGVLQDGHGAKQVKGEPCHCHGNSALVWSRKKEKRTICTGYALSDDGLWRCHSWVLEAGRILETTTGREAYFGFSLTIMEAVMFSIGEGVI
jgi:hypothetical protein